MEKLLLELGLSKAESQIYLALLRLGEAKVGEIIKIVKVSSSNVHEALGRLVSKGLVSFILKNGVKHYSAASPNNLFLLLEEKKEEIKSRELKLKSAVSEMIKAKPIELPEEQAEVYVGLVGVKSAFAKLLKKSSGEYKFFYKYEPSNVKLIHTFFAKMDIQDYYAEIPTKGIFSKGYEQWFKKRSYAKFQFKFTDYPIPSSVNIYGECVLMVSWSEKPVAFLVRSKDISEMYVKLFDEVWNRTK